MSLSTESIQIIECLNDKVFFLYYVQKNISPGSKMFMSVDKVFDRTIKEVVIPHVYHYIYLSFLMSGLKFKVSEGSKGSMSIFNGVPPGYVNISLPLLIRLKQ